MQLFAMGSARPSPKHQLYISKYFLHRKGRTHINFEVDEMSVKDRFNINYVVSIHALI